MSDSAAAPAAPSAPGGRERTGRKRDGGPGRIKSVGVFYQQVVAELRKVIWPTRKELLTYTSVVLVFVVVMVVIVALLDLAFSEGVLAVFGGDTTPVAPEQLPLPADPVAPEPAPLLTEPPS